MIGPMLMGMPMMPTAFPMSAGPTVSLNSAKQTGHSMPADTPWRMRAVIQSAEGLCPRPVEWWRRRGLQDRGCKESDGPRAVREPARHRLRIVNGLAKHDMKEWSVWRT